MIFIQDIKERQVYWFFFPIVALCSGMLLYKNTNLELFIKTVCINLIFIGCLLASVYLYAKLKLKTAMLNTFGLGDILLFIALAFGFANIPFLVFFVFGLIFSLLLHLFFKRKSRYEETVPLAGYLSLFFAIVYLCQWTFNLQPFYNSFIV